MKKTLTHTDAHLTVTDAGGAYTVALRDGQLPVQVYDQSGNPWERGEQLISLEAASDPSPRWGQGWTVVDTTGTEHWFASNWDSSG